MQRRWGILPNTLKLYRRAQCGPSQMNIAKPLTRATAVADQISHRRSISSYYYRFPKIPRPKRNALYYSHWSNGGSPIKSIESTLSKFKNQSKNLRFSLQKRPFSNRFFVKRWSNKDGLKRRISSVKGKKPRGLKGKKLTRQLLALTSLCVFLFSIAASKITHTEPKEEKEVKPTSWKLYAYSTLPLKAMSRLWGQFNSIDLPVWLRVPSFKLYSLAFGVNLNEMEETDLTKFKNLGEFFYRTIKPETRPIDLESELVSPCDGKVLKFGIIENGEIEQVKGMTYSLDALLGTDSNAVAKRLAAPTHHVDFEHDMHDNEVMQRHEEFAQLNGISYTLDDLLGGESKNTHHLNAYKYKNEGDASIDNPSAAQVEKVSSDVGETSSEKNKQLFFAVIYLAPGDYHRFHSPTNWVATMRRHFIGELFSVAPYFQKTLEGLFVLNERVAMLGYWKHGFFSMTPVGATNVGSIKVNFDKDLSTNEVYEHSIYGDQDDEVSVISNQSTRSKKVVKNTCYEASYANASRVLGGQPLTKGQEVGGFKLGSTVVLVFEAPQSFEFNLKDGQPVRMGQSIGREV